MTRKIDKRACRKFALPELEFNLNEGVLHVESCPYIIRTAVRNIAGQRILMLYIYQREHILTGASILAGSCSRAGMISLLFRSEKTPAQRGNVRCSILWIGYTVLTPNALSTGSRMRLALLVFVSVTIVSFLH